MANQNVTQLTQQTISADPTSLFYAVINGATDTGLPISVLVHNLGLTGTPTTPTATLNTNTTQIASTAFVMSQAALYAPLAGATFTGPVTIPTVTINGGTINSASIGATTPGTGVFTTLSTTGLASLNSISTASATITGGSLNSTSIGATTASTGAFTTLSASSTISGTGFSTYLASPPAIGTTIAAAGKFTTLQATGTITPSSTSGIVGTTTNDNANAGSIGEYPTPTNLTGVALAAGGTYVNIASISLTAGDWDVTGSAFITPTNSTTVLQMSATITTTSGGSFVGGQGASFNVPYTSNGNGEAMTLPTTRISITSTTTVYLTGSCSSSGGTGVTANGYIRARRIR